MADPMSAEDRAHPEPSVAALFVGELDEEAIERLLERAEEDPDFSEELDLACDLHGALEAAGAPGSSGSSGFTSEGLPEAPRPRALRPAQLAALAGLAATALFLLWVVRGPRGDSAPAQVAQTRGAESTAVAAVDLDPPPYLPLELRAADAPLAMRFRRAMEPYLSGDWAAARRELTAFLVDSPDHASARFYRGAVNQVLGDAGAALVDYRAAADLAAGQVSEHALWRLAALELSRDAPARARVTLEELVALDGVFARNARARLAELDD